MSRRARLERTRLGHFLRQATEEQINTALAMQRAGDSRLFGQLMVALRGATPEEIERALVLQRAARGELGAQGLKLIEGATASSKSAAEAIDELVELVGRVTKRKE